MIMELLRILKNIIPSRRIKANDILHMAGRKMKFGKESQLVESVRFETTSKGRKITVYTVKGDWHNDIYR